MRHTLFLAIIGPLMLSSPCGFAWGDDASRRPNVLFIVVDQQRFDTIAALGNTQIWTPNLDRLANRGLAFTNAYSTCPVCLPARYTIRTGCEPPTTRAFTNATPQPAVGQAAAMTDRCGPYLAETMKNLGYRTFGIGKFHTHPRNEQLGFDVHLHSEEPAAGSRGRLSIARHARCACRRGSSRVSLCGPTPCANLPIRQFARRSRISEESGRCVALGQEVMLS